MTRKDHTATRSHAHQTKEQWLIMYANVRGLKGKKTGITEILNQNEPHLFLITETQLRSNVTEYIKGYTFYGRKREAKNGGGVGIAVRNDLRNNIACHISDRPIEIMWISVRRKNLPPVLFVTYYGRQESRTSNVEIETEMILLSEEITEMKNEGELFLLMDGNAKIGILNEPISRNGRYLLDVFEKNWFNHHEQ